MLTLHLSIILLLIIVNGFFAMAEIALVAARNARLRPLAEAANPGAQAALELKADPSRLLSTVQIGVTGRDERDERLFALGVQAGKNLVDGVHSLEEGGNKKTILRMDQRMGMNGKDREDTR